jgi:protein-tyrosine phosphatase
VYARDLMLRGIFNLRDLGGHATLGGRRVRSGRVFRSDALHRMEDEDAAKLARLGIRKIFDLRSDAEVLRDVSVAVAGAERIHVPLVTTTLSPFDPEIDWRRIDLRERYVEMLAVGGAAIRAVLQAATDDAPILFHCTAGKDRTGVVAAVLLRALEVPDARIVEDYACSEANLRLLLGGLREELTRRGMTAEAIDYLTSSPPHRMRRTLVELDRRWGSTEAYLRWIGIDDASLERLRVNLLC